MVLQVSPNPMSRKIDQFPQMVGCKFCLFFVPRQLRIAVNSKQKSSTCLVPLVPLTISMSISPWASVERSPALRRGHEYETVDLLPAARGAAGESTFVPPKRRFS